MTDGFIGFAMGVIAGAWVTFFVMCAFIAACIFGDGDDDDEI